jgi:putative transposase
MMGELVKFIDEQMRLLWDWKGIEVVELNVMQDHVHAVFGISPKYSVAETMGMLKGKTAIKIFEHFPGLKKKPYWGNHFWARGYCVSTIGLDEKMIRKYVKYQEEQEKREEIEQQGFLF